MTIQRVLLSSAFTIHSDLPAIDGIMQSTAPSESIWWSRRGRRQPKSPGERRRRSPCGKTKVPRLKKDAKNGNRGSPCGSPSAWRGVLGIGFYSRQRRIRRFFRIGSGGVRRRGFRVGKGNIDGPQQSPRQIPEEYFDTDRPPAENSPFHSGQRGVR